MSVHLYNHQLHALLKPVTPIAASQPSVWDDVLASVWIQRQGNYLYGAATNRYVCAIQRIAVEPAQLDGKFSGLLAVDSVKHMLRLFPASRHSIPAVTISQRPEGTSGPKRLAIATLAAGLLPEQRNDPAAPSISVEYPLLSSARMPDLFSLAAGKIAEEKPDRIDRIGINVRQLGLFAGVAQGSEPVVLNLGKSAASPTILQYGEDFLGLLMPVRLVDPKGSLEAGSDYYANTLTAWREVLTPLHEELAEAKKL